MILTKYFIYGLASPFEDEIKYVGCTSDMTTRLYGHVAKARSLKRHNKLASGKNKLYAWIDSLLIKNMRPKMIELFTAKDINLASEAEENFIKEIKPEFNSKYNHKYSSKFISHNCQYPEHEWKKNIEPISDEELYENHQEENRIEMLNKICPSYFQHSKQKRDLIWNVFIKKYHPIFNLFSNEDIAQIERIISE